MFNLKKKLAVALSGVLTLAMLAPAAVAPSVAKAAESITLDDIGVESVGTDVIRFSGKKLYVDTVVKGKVKSTEVYKNKVADLSYLNGKAAELVIYADATRTETTKAVTVKIAAQPKITAKYNPETGVVDVKSGGAAAPVDSFDIYVGADIHLGENMIGGEGYTKEQYDGFLKKGVTGYAVLKESGDLNVANDTDLSASGATISITPVSKKAKFKIPAMAKAPKVTIDVNTISFKLPKGCSYVLSNTEKELATGAAADKAVTVDIVAIASEGGVQLTDEALTLEVKKDKTAKKPESKTLEVVVPQQPKMTKDDISTGGLIYCEPAYNAKGTVQTGIKVTNATSCAMQVAVVSDLSKVDIVNGKGADKVKWKNVKANKSINISAKQAKDKYVIYRMAGVKKSKNSDMKLASNWVSDENKVVIEEAVKPTLTVSASKIADETKDGVVSPCTITVTVGEGNKAYYTVETKQKKDTLKIGATVTDLKATELPAGGLIKGEDVKGKFVAVYEADSTGKIVAYGCTTAKVE